MIFFTECLGDALSLERWEFPGGNPTQRLWEQAGCGATEYASDFLYSSPPLILCEGEEEEARRTLRSVQAVCGTR